MKGWFTVSFPGSFTAAAKEVNDLRISNAARGGKYQYRVKRNPDYKGYTIFGRRR